MRVARKDVKEVFDKAEKSLNTCWNLLADVKEAAVFSKNFGERFILFQDELASAIFDLQKLRDKIILEEKECVLNRKKYRREWFLSTVRRLSSYKEGIDEAVCLAKSLGDAYAYFFYQYDLELLTNHLSHEKVVNHTSGLGEMGELIFLQRVKHFKGRMTLYHGITNILRYGDYSFIDLKKMRVTEIGELKTRKIDDSTGECTLTVLVRNELDGKESLIKDASGLKERKERQIIGIANFLVNKKEPNPYQKDLINKSYAQDVESLIKSTRINKEGIVQVSEGLLFCCIKLRKRSLYSKIFSKTPKINYTNSDELIATAQKLMKPNNDRNSLIISTMLQKSDLKGSCIPGTIPTFWHRLSVKALKCLYFSDCYVVSLFNPIHLIERLESLGFYVESKYTHGDKDPKTKKVLQGFDIFLQYINDKLMTEDFVVESVLATTEHPLANNGNTQIKIKLQQCIEYL